MPDASPQQFFPAPGGNDEGLHLPPRYSTLSLATLPVYPAAGEFDISRSGDDRGDSEPVSRQAFDFCLQNKGAMPSGNDDAWASLRLFSVVPASLQRPRYTSGENIEGAVLLNLKRPQTILSISIVLRGEMLTSGRLDGAHRFLEVTTLIWDSTMHHPSSTTPSDTTGGKGRLRGRYALPFSIPFPTDFPDSFNTTDKRNRQSQSENTRTMYSTPQTVCQRGISANIQYDLTLKIVTSGIFNSKHRISAPILYVPVIRAPPLSPLRASAYACGSFLLGPKDDPAGWQALPIFFVEVSSRGSNTASTCQIECTAYIANPTTYTRGSAIPCYLICKTTGTGDHDQALAHAFVSQNCVSLTLLQRVQYRQDPRVVAGPATFSGTIKTGQTREERTRHLEEGGSAVWWTPSTQGTGDSGQECPIQTSPELTLEGEIHTDVGLLPTCQVPFFDVSHWVRVSLMPSQDLAVTCIPERGMSVAQPSSPASSSSGRPPFTSHELPTWPVGIVTAHASTGPVPAAFTTRPVRQKKKPSTVQDVQFAGIHSGSIMM